MTCSLRTSSYRRSWKTSPGSARSCCCRETLVIASFVRGLSVRDVEATLAEALGDQAAISKSTVSAVCPAIKDEYQAWARHRLDGITLDYLFLDASFFRMHPGSSAEPVLAAWALPPAASPPSSAWHQAAASPPTPGTTSWPTSPAAAWPPRCWSSPTGHPA
jgi:hypothetical protein